MSQNMSIHVLALITELGFLNEDLDIFKKPGVVFNSILDIKEAD